MVAHSCKHSTQETEVERLQFQDQSGLHTEIVSKQKQKPNKQTKLIKKKKRGLVELVKW
jgi:hypothetical protein